MKSLEQKSEIEIPGLIHALFSPLGVTELAIRTNELINERVDQLPGEGIIDRLYVGIGVLSDIGKWVAYGMLINELTKYF